MKNFIVLCAALVGFIPCTIAQDSATLTFHQATTQTFDPKTFESPYTTSFKKDAPIIAGGVALTGLGVYLISKKKDLTMDQLAKRTKDRVPFFDRGSAGFYSQRADKDSYIPFKASFVMPVVMMLINKNERQKPVQVLALYVETMAITGALFTITAGTIHRSRPLVYGTLAPLDKRLSEKSQRAFFAGHTAATASATFFAAKVFQDFNPDSKLKPYVWTVAAAVPALVGYLRYKAGMHFLSDNLLGYAIGAGAGILVPQLHKNDKFKQISFVPEIGTNYKGVSLTYNFK